VICEKASKNQLKKFQNEVDALFCTKATYESFQLLQDNKLEQYDKTFRDVMTEVDGFRRG
jgi:hypothetical protein